MAGLSDAQLFDWLRLIRSENVGPATFRQLINTYGSAARALEALPHLSRRSGKPIRVHSSEATEREMDEAARRGLRLVVTTDPDYPYALRAFDPPPPILTLAGGSPALSQRPAVAMVGSRNASAAGMRLCADMSEVCGRAGLVVVSGLARGIDAASHRASLASGTIAVLAGGHANIYPPEHESLAAEIVERGGAVVTEMPLGWQARAQDFLRRNRIIAGIALGVVVIEAARRSGALSTARHANAAGRLVMAVPGFPLDPRSEGPNLLLRNGATLVRNGEDILEELSPLVRRDELPDLFLDSADGAFDETLEPDEAPPADLKAAVLGALGKAPVNADTLARTLGANIAALQVVLLELDLAGALSRHPGGRISLY